MMSSPPTPNYTYSGVVPGCVTESVVVSVPRAAPDHVGRPAARQAKYMTVLSAHNPEHFTLKNQQVTKSVFSAIRTSNAASAEINVPLHSVLSLRQRIVKRGFDLLVALLLLLVTLPVLLLIALLLKLASGSLLTKQTRVGAGGRLFTLYRFRTAPVSASEYAGAPRYTPVGAMLRRTHLDLLPQLFNVLRGDLSIVGPHPLVPSTAGMLVDRAHTNRLLIPQGIIGWAQVNYRPGMSTEESLAYDLYYIEHYSLWFDIKILLLALPALLVREPSLLS